MDVKIILIFSLSLLVTLSFCEEDGKGVVEEICGKGQGDTKPETPDEKKEETEAEENKDDKKDKKFFYAGDMRITEKQKEEIDRQRQTGQKREATRRQNAKWPNGTVYYEIDRRLDKKASEAIQAAIRDIEEYTCITFVKRIDRSIDQFVKFIKDQGCWSYVGMLSKAALRQGYKQEISIGRGCEYKGTAIHEIFHALGFEHEHSRPDRDKYIKINFQNIEKKNKYNFDKITNTINLGVGYDYNSIMHYPDWAFSNNGKPTIEAVGNAIGAEIGQRDGMTAGDIEQVNKFYECEKMSGSDNGGSFTQILKRGMADSNSGKGSGSSNGTSEDSGSNGNSGSNGGNEVNGENGASGNNGTNEDNGNGGDKGKEGGKKPADKKGGKCENQYNTEQKNKARKMARKEELMRKQHENIKRIQEEERVAGMLKKRSKV